MTPGPGMSKPPTNSWVRDKKSDGVVVFVHGFLSSSAACWTARGDGGAIQRSWPELLGRDSRFAHLDVFVAEYYTALTSASYSVPDCSRALYDVLSLGGTSGVLARKHVIFICHSLGGVVLRHMLTTRADGFREKELGIVLCASPSRGSRQANWSWVFNWALGNEVLKQLRPNNPLLGDLHQRFKLFLSESSETIHGLELAEHKSERWGRFGLWVSKDSAHAYFHDQAVIPESTHSSIVKPRSRGDATYTKVAGWLEQHFSSKEIPRGTTKSTLRGCSSISEVAAKLTEEFGCRWETGSFDSSRPSVVVYWPVRLRSPSVIHAAQAFTAAALQKAGARIELWLDDLGSQDFNPDTFEARIKDHIERAGGSGSDLVVHRFASFVDGDGAALWRLTREWMGQGERKLGYVLKVSKLLSDPGAAADDDVSEMEVLFRKRPRRLLTPSVVWSGIEATVRSDGGHGVMTLGGADETHLWQAWRELGGRTAGSSVGHLYLPELLSGAAGSERPIYMPDTPLAWDSAQDIRNALVEEMSKYPELPSALDEGRLIPWVARQCIFLPRSVRGDGEPLEIGGDSCETAEEFLGLGQEELLHALVRELEYNLLRTVARCS